VSHARSSSAFAAAAGAGAGLLWGLAFLLPEMLRGWSAVTLNVGRYLIYGTLALTIVVVSGPALREVARRHWRPAALFAFASDVGYYLLLVLGIRTVGAPVTGIIIGCIPVTLAVVGNVVARSLAWRRLAAPIALVAAGLIIVNIVELRGAAVTTGSSVAMKIVGVLCAFGAVALWTWYGLTNARFLERHPEVPETGWSAVPGLGPGAISLVALPLAAMTGQLGRTGDGPGDLGALLVISLILGVAVSWGGTTLWNVASGRLPPTAAGMLINVETVAGLTYVYAARQDWPPTGQLAGLACILAGVAVVVRMQALRPAPPAPAGTFHPTHRTRTDV
jgi:drug/metabolite transporter (DMT)-like permease